jgi:N-acetylmuramoyl-L-alanine amidase
MSKFKLKPKNILGHSDIAPTRKKDPGEKFPWKLFAKKRIGIWHSLSMKKLKQSRLKLVEAKEEIKFFENLNKIGYAFNNSKNLKKKNFLKLIIKSFQRRFRQNLIDGKIDKECYLISENIVKKFN